MGSGLEAEKILASSARSSWVQPEVYDLALDYDRVELHKAREAGRVRTVFDNTESIIDDLYELEHPDGVADLAARQEYVDRSEFDSDTYGRWVLYPWSGELVHFPAPEDYRHLCTSRYRELVTSSEQAKINLARVAIFGMSVGGKIAEALARGSVGSAIAIGDMDTLSVSNLGRVNLDMRDVGSEKVDAIAQKISYINPFLEQVHFRNGFNADMTEDLEAFNPTILVDEVDDMVASAGMRIFCREHAIPYITASDVDRSPVIEVCRHDLGKAALYASGASDRVAYNLLEGRLSQEQKDAIFARVVGYRNLTPRLIDSLPLIGKTIGGIPQLNSTTTKVTGYMEDIIRDISLGESSGPNTGRYVVAPHGRLKQKGSPLDFIRSVSKYIQNTKK